MKKNLRVSQLLTMFFGIALISLQHAFAAVVIKVNGEVKETSGEPLVGVSVQIKGTTKGTNTDVNGKFSIEVPDGDAVLAFSFIGYEPQEIRVGNQSFIKVSLNVDSKALAEVVVVGYGTQQKVNLTGAVGVATSERIQSRPIANTGEGLQGVIPNLNVNVRNLCTA